MKKRAGWLCLALFLLSVPFSNWWLTEHGFWDLPWLGKVPSAVWVVGFAFVVRDLAQLLLGRTWAWAAIAVGVFLSWWVAEPAIAFASGVAFLWSESTDALVFTPLANRGTKLFLLGISLSGYLASVVDSALFLRIAFHSFDGWLSFTLAKVFFVMLATPVAWGVRRALLARDSQAELVGAH